jgi:hypothetical protein
MFNRACLRKSFIYEKYCQRIMKKRYADSVHLLAVASLLALFAILISGCSSGNIVKTKEDIDRSTRIVTLTEVGQNDLGEESNFSVYTLEYIRDEKKYAVWWSPKLRPSLDYLKNNAKKGDKVLTWWDNGHLIRGYVKLEPIAYTPSYDILDTVVDSKWDTETLGEFSSKDDLTNIAYALLADTPKITSGIMKRYGTKWVYIARIDTQKIPGMVKLMGEDISNYLDEVGDPKQGVMHKVLFKMGDGWPMQGFEKRYEDEYAFVYELTS